MDEAENAEQVRRWGLCASCRHLVLIRSDRGSTFVQCGLSKTDPRFPRYPPLPVIVCGGHIARTGNDKIK
jgi:hypothetical protein